MSAHETSALATEAESGPRMYGSRGLGFASGHGARLVDFDGNEYIDCASMIGVASLGHAHQDLAEAIAAQSRQLLSCFGSFANDRRSELYARLRKLLPWSRRVFLCNSGTEAIEAALKIACAATGRSGLTCATGGFHGRTLGALALNSRKNHRAAVESLLPEARRILPGNTGGIGSAIDETTAAVFVEPIQGEGGVRPLPADWLRAIQDRCRDVGALFVLDEVQCGVARSGHMFAHEDAGLEPDLLCLAKGLAGGVPIGAVVLGEAAKDPAMGLHGSTFGGNPLAAAAAGTVLDVIQRDGLVQRAHDLGARALERLHQHLDEHVREVRGRGLMIGIECRDRVQSILKRLQERGVIALAAGPTILRLLPPLIISDEEWDTAITTIIEEVVR